MPRDDPYTPRRGPAETANLGELAARLNISKTLVYDLARVDRLPVPVIRLGRRLVVSRAAMERVLAGGWPTARGDDRGTD